MSARWFDRDGNEVAKGTADAVPFRFVWSPVVRSDGRVERVLGAEGDAMEAARWLRRLLNAPPGAYPCGRPG
jgi:hypothetical protein